MPATLTLVVHERIGRWARQLRPRLVGHPARLLESRSASDLLAHVRGKSCPILIVELGESPTENLDALDQALQHSPNALAMVLVDREDATVTRMAQEIGATIVLPADIRPPELVDVITRWLAVAWARGASDGWQLTSSDATDPIDSLLTTITEPTRHAE